MRASEITHGLKELGGSMLGGIDVLTKASFNKGNITGFVKGGIIFTIITYAICKCIKEKPISEDGYMDNSNEDYEFYKDYEPFEDYEDYED